MITEAEFAQLEAGVQEAQDLLRSGDARGALARYCAIFEKRWREAGNTTSRLIAADLTVIECIAEISLPYGCAAQADTLFRTAAEGYLRLNSRYWFDLLTLKRVHVALGNGQILGARELLRAMEPSFGKLEEISSEAGEFSRLEGGYQWSRDNGERAALFSALYLQVGRLQLSLGMGGAAVRAFERGLQFARELSRTGLHNGELLLKLWLARARVESGELDGAARELAAIRAELKEPGAPDCEMVWLEISAQLAIFQGRLGAAQQLVSQVWLWCASRGYMLPALHAALSLCQLYILLNKTLEAKSTLDAVRAVALRNNWPEIRDSAERFRLVAEARARRDVSGPDGAFELQMGGEEGARTPAPVSEFQVKTHGFSLRDFQLRCLQFQFYLGCGNLAAARKSLDRLQAFRASDSRVVQAGLDAQIAAWLYFNGHHAAAIPHAREASAAYRQMAMLPDQWRTQRLLRDALEHLGDGSGERERLAEENQSLLEQMTGFLSLEDQITYLLNKPTDHEEFLSRKIRGLQQSSQAKKSWWARCRSFIDTQKNLNSLLDEVFWEREWNTRLRLHPEQGGGVERRATRLWKRLLSCGRDQAQIAFVVLPDSVLAISICLGRMRYRVLQTSRVGIRELVRQWHEAVPESRPDHAAGAAARLCRELQLESLLDELPSRVRRIMILPDDALHGFPFAALPVRGGYFIERFALSIGFQPSKRKIRRRGTAGQAVHLAGMTAGTPPLPETARHIGEIQSGFAEQGIDATATFNDEMPVEGLLDFLRRATLFHISCHGEYAQNCPEATGWQIVTGKSTTGLVGLPRLFRLDLTGVHHATVMSCWGADNFVFPGRWVMSLPEVLWRAGAGSVTACLWEVSEDCVREFVAHFYANLRNLPVDCAVQAAMTAMLKAPGGRREAFDWAGFQVYGEPELLRF